MLRSLFAGTLVIAVMLGSPPAVAQRGPASVVVAQAEMREIAETTPIIAQMVGTVEAEVATRAAGVVDEVLFEVGERVTAGQELARLDDRTFAIQLQNIEAALEAARAGVAVAEARVTLTEQALNRQVQLRDSNAFSRGAYEDLEATLVERNSELARARAQVAVAEAELARAELEMSHTITRAPFDGVVVMRMAQPGQYILLGQAVGTLLDIERLEIEADVPAELIAGLMPGREVGVLTPGGNRLTAWVRVLLPTEAVSTRTQPVRFTVDLTEFEPYELADGRSVTLELPVSAPRSALMLPKDALVQAANGWRVFVARDGKATPHIVTLGQSDGDRIEVLSGVAAGDYVVVRGNERLRPGQEITPRRADGTELVADPAPAPAEPDPIAPPAVESGTAGAATRPATTGG